MEILITNHQMHLFAGSETYSFALAQALASRGHGVAIFTAEKGVFGRIVESQGIPVIQDPDELRGRRFDIIHAHHNAMAMVARGLLPGTPMVFVSHGPLAELEQPPSIDTGIGVFIAVSEEVRERLISITGATDVPIVRNGVDTERFRPRAPIGETPRRLLVISNHFPEGHWQLLSAVCAERAIEVQRIGLQSRFEWHTEEVINSADVVVSLGRGALEAMACGRAVLVWDHFGSDGWMTRESYARIRTCNFSGRSERRSYDAESLRAELDAYVQDMGTVNRSLALEHHDIRDRATELEGIYHEAITRGVKGNYPMPVRELLHYFHVWRDRQQAINATVELSQENARLAAELAGLKPRLQALVDRLNEERRQLENERRKIRGS